LKAHVPIFVFARDDRFLFISDLRSIDHIVDRRIQHHLTMPMGVEANLWFMLLGYVLHMTSLSSIVDDGDIIYIDIESTHKKNRMRQCEFGNGSDFVL
jgi:hypothetical protein